MKVEIKKLIKFLKIKLTETSPIAMEYKREIIKRLRQNESKVTTKIMHPLKESAQLREMAEMTSKFYGLNVVIDESEFSSSTHVDFKIVTPSGKIVGLFHMSFFQPWDHWTFGGQTFIISEQLGELRVKALGLRKKK